MTPPVCCLPLLLAAAATAADWPQWRGPSGQNVAESADPPVSWSESENVAWRAKVPGEGHASPTVVGDRVFLAVASRANRAVGVAAFDAADGKLAWARTALKDAEFPTVHPNNSMASPTVASDGRRLFATFHVNDEIRVFAYGLDGERLWEGSAGRFAPQRYEFGYGASPTVWDDTVVVANESDGPGGSRLIAFDAATGEERWQTERRGTITFGSPIVGRVAGTDTLLIAGGGSIAGYDPNTGDERWSVGGFATAACGTPVWEGSLVFASGGYPESVTMAVDASTGEEVWRNGVKCYEQSLLVRDRVLYGVDENGVLNAWNAKTGERFYRKRLGGGQSASLVFAAGGGAGPRIYQTNEAGETTVFRAGREFESIAESRLGDSAFATPTPVGGALYYRAGVREDGRLVDYLFKLAE